MKELKFRFYDHKISKEMIYQQSYEAKNVIFDKWETTPKCSPLMQYTGLKDTYNREIYEGDIVETWSQGLRGVGQVKQRIDGLWLMYPAWQEEIQWDLAPNKEGHTDVEIIGNIYENPELIDRGRGGVQ